MPLARRHYQTPPLIEAVAEFRFASEAWDQTMPGLIYAQLMDEFPTKETIRALEVSVVPADADEVQQQVVHVDRLRLRRADGKALIVLGAHYLSISRLPPYEEWEEFLPIIQRALAVYRDIASPQEVQRIGLRYVNQIEFDAAEPIPLEEYFHFFPHTGEHLPAEHGPFICGVQIPYDDRRDIAKVQLADQQVAAPASAIVLDIDYFLAQAGVVSFDEVDAWLVDAHARVEQIFEGCIKDELRDRFGVRPEAT